MVKRIKVRASTMTFWVKDPKKIARWTATAKAAASYSFGKDTTPAVQILKVEE